MLDPAAEHATARGPAPAVLDLDMDDSPDAAMIAMLHGNSAVGVAMFRAWDPRRGLNACVASDTGGAAALIRLQQLWQAVLAATNPGEVIFPHISNPYMPPEGTFAPFYNAYLSALDWQGGPAACYALLRTVSQLAETGDYTAFPALPPGAWALRPVPSGLGVLGDAAPRAPRAPRRAAPHPLHEMCRRKPSPSPHGGHRRTRSPPAAAAAAHNKSLSATLASPALSSTSVPDFEGVCHGQALAQATGEDVLEEK